ncbi:MAG: PLP-dependent aspartate aminotransferase family protein [Myxococcales bacterium]|nr:PLP-dependent aspartate aminotransferase family protein [Myxococcales bacterium]
MKDKGIDTTLVHAGRDPHATYPDHGSVNPPLFQSSTMLFRDTSDAMERAKRFSRHYPKPDAYHVDFYGRLGTQTTFAFERGITEIDGAFRALAFPSGLSAITTTLQALSKAGDHVLVVDTCYKPVREFCDRVLIPNGVEVTYYGPREGARIETRLRRNTRLVYCESPGSVTLEVQDLRSIVRAVRAYSAAHELDRIPVALDNTWATSCFFRPLTAPPGDRIDLSIQSASKYIGGHSDVMLGVVAVAKEADEEARHPLFEKLWNARVASGICVGPSAARLGLRGLPTLGVRLQRHRDNALTLAKWLQHHDKVEQVLHPGLQGSPDHDLFVSTFTGSTGLFSIVLDPSIGADAMLRAMDTLTLFGIGGSWGGYESLVLPFWPKGNAISRTVDATLAARNLIRISAGLECADDLLADLDQALARL